MVINGRRVDSCSRCAVLVWFDLVFGWFPASGQGVGIVVVSWCLTEGDDDFLTYPSRLTREETRLLLKFQ